MVRKPDGHGRRQVDKVLGAAPMFDVFIASWRYAAWEC